MTIAKYTTGTIPTAVTLNGNWGVFDNQQQTNLTASTASSSASFTVACKALTIYNLGSVGVWVCFDEAATLVKGYRIPAGESRQFDSGSSGGGSTAVHAITETSTAGLRIWGLR